MSFLDFFRSKKKIIFYIILANFLIAMLAGLGQYIYTVNKNTVIKIGKDRITREEFSKLYNNLLSNDPDVSKTTAINTLLNQKVLLYEAEKAELEVSKQQIIQKIASIPFFHKGGNFAQDEYYKKLKFMKEAPNSFESKIEDNIKMVKIVKILNEQVKTSIEEEKIELDISGLNASEYKYQNRELILLNWIENKKDLYNISINEY